MVTSSQPMYAWMLTLRSVMLIVAFPRTLRKMQRVSHLRVESVPSKGYICPDYNDGEIEYESSCDVFLFGVFLCELLTGKMSPSGKHGHYIAFEKKENKALIDNLDATVEWDDDTRESLVELELNASSLKVSFIQQSDI